MQNAITNAVASAGQSAASQLIKDNCISLTKLGTDTIVGGVTGGAGTYAGSLVRRWHNTTMPNAVDWEWDANGDFIDHTRAARRFATDTGSNAVSALPSPLNSPGCKPKPAIK